MDLKPCNNSQALEKRVLRFLSSGQIGRRKIARVIDQLNSVGNAAIFGGMLRDICIIGGRKFYSDVDIVVSDCSMTQLESVLHRYRSKRNKFGGVRIWLDRWKFDIWRLEDTWAFREKILRCDGLASLIDSAFFDWDAVAFDTQSSKLTARRDFFERIGSRVLDINLNASPNPTGNAIKALRYSERYNASLTSRLANFVFSTLADKDPGWLKSYEIHASDVPVLTRRSIEKVLHELSAHQRNAPLFEFKSRNVQDGLLIDSSKH